MQQRAALASELPGGFKNIVHSSKTGVVQLCPSGPDQVWSREAPQRRSGVPWGPILGSRGVVFGLAAEGVRFSGNQAVDLRTLDLDLELGKSNSNSNSTSNSATQTRTRLRTLKLTLDLELGLDLELDNSNSGPRNRTRTWQLELQLEPGNSNSNSNSNLHSAPSFTSDSNTRTQTRPGIPSLAELPLHFFSGKGNLFY